MSRISTTSLPLSIEGRTHLTQTISSWTFSPDSSDLLVHDGLTVSFYSSKRADSPQRHQCSSIDTSKVRDSMLCSACRLTHNLVTQLICFHGKMMILYRRTVAPCASWALAEVRLVQQRFDADGSNQGLHMHPYPLTQTEVSPGETIKPRRLQDTMVHFPNACWE